jgi:hypothetical protein
MYSLKWLDKANLNRVVNEYLRVNWEQIRSDLALNKPLQGHINTQNTTSAIGEGFKNSGTASVPKSSYVKTSLWTIVIRLVPGDSSRIKVITGFPNGRGY